VIGYDKTFNNGVLGVSMADLESDLTQLDDRVDEDSVIAQRVWSVYGQVHGKADYLSVSLKHGLNNVSGERKTAIDRAAHYDYDSSTSELALKYGHRFDLSDGRSAITPYVRYIKTRNSTPEYTETDAGALSLNVHKSSIVKETAELGLSASHKGRFSGVKALTVLHAAVGKDVDISDLTVSANYTGATDTEHADYTSFTTPAETWADNYVSLGANLQLEAKKGLLVKLGANGELRQSRQNYSADLSLIWAF
jgi:outer membrane autotransporter protein